MNGSTVSESELTRGVSRARGQQSKLLSHAGFEHVFAGVETRTRTELAAQLRVAEPTLYEVTQVHGAVVSVAGGTVSAMRSVEADALIGTPERLRGVAVRTADCVPLLLADVRSGAVAAVHAGWRGVEAQVIAAAVSAMAHGAELVAAVGPHIGPCCFEVSREVAERIARASSSQVITRDAGEKAWIDLGAAAEFQLRALRIDRVEHVFVCTHCGEGFHSYRRDPGVGRQWSAIATRVATGR